MNELVRQKTTMSKKTITIILSSIVLAGVFALLTPVTHVSALNFADRIQNKASAAAQRQSNDLARIITRGDSMIQVRLTSLQNLLTRVQNDKRLTPDEKTSFENDITTTSSNLTTLKTKLDADTDAPTALADAKSIVTSYRIYMIFEPKIRLLAIIDNLQTTSIKISGIIASVQNLLNTLKSEGKDVTTAQNALNDASSQVSAINSLLAADKTLVSNVQIGTTDPQSIFVQVRKDLATIRGDVTKIRTDFETVKTSLKSAGITPTTALPSTH